MNHDNERKAFEAECKLLKYNGDMTRHYIGNFYTDQTTNWMWQMWLSSKNREGYKLMPFEPTGEIINRMTNTPIEVNHLCDNADVFLSEGESLIAYKAMIGGCDD